jgi:eukaryotic-like serine/threonine-protein kinase
MSGMSEPTLEAFLGALARSRLFEPPELEHLVTRAKADSARALADALVRFGALTHYQADKLLRGRTAGLVIGPYTVLAPLGRGGMGTVVYLARDRRVAEEFGDSVLVALKLLPVRIGAAQPITLERFRREMSLGKRAKHPNVVRTFATGDTDDVHYLALEYVPGLTLREWVKKHGPMPVGEAACVFADVAAGLAHVHAKGLVHRDVKLANVIVRPDGRAVLLDLGLAIAPAEPRPDNPAVAGGKGYVVGTMDYLAPEQGRDSAAVGPKADVYGLGCALFAALTARLPFPAQDAKAKIRRHRTDPPPPIPEVPPEFEKLIHRFMSKEPDARPNATEAEVLLREWASVPMAQPVGDPLAAADAPGTDAGLWESTPGDELPTLAPEGGDANPFARMDESGSAAVLLAEAPERAPKALLWVGALAALALLLLVLVLVARRL